MPLRSSSTRLVVIAAVLLAGLAVAWTLRPSQRPLVEDGAGLFAADQLARVSEHHAYLLQDHDIDYRVVTLDNAGDINRYAVERYADLEIGKASKGARGLLLVIDAGANLVRLEVGYSLEGVYPDAFIAYVEHRQMVPFFRAGRVADGILATTELIVTRAQRARANAGFEGEAWYAGTGGAGATTRARLGEGIEPPAGTDKGGPAGGSPSETLTAYFKAMQARNANRDLHIYTPATRRMLADWVITPAQMDNVVKTYRTCTPEAERISNGHAVIRYPVKQRQCAPFFFQQIEGAWRLDLTMMQYAIRFGRSNAWRFDMAVDHPYQFAFQDWRFDRNGFPK